MKKVFGLKELSGQVNEQLMKETQHKSNPEKWNWVPQKPEKIKNLKEIVEKEKAAVRFASMTNYEPSAERQKVVLVFAIGNLQYGLIKHLEEEKMKFFFIDFIQFTLKGEIKIKIDNEKEVKILEIEGLKLDLNDVSAIIWNPPSFFIPLFDFEHIPFKRGRNHFLFKKRWTQFLRDLPLLVPEGAEWLPGKPLNGSQDWQNKIGEYNLAREIGLFIPPIICTNSKEDLMKFSEKHGKELVLREFSCPPYSFPPIRLNADNLNFRYFKNSPSCFQKYINKLCEFRVVILFNQVFPCKIYSQDSELTKNDWRVHDDANVKWELVELPLELTEKLILFRKKLNLNWCSVDLILGEDNKYYFLEANRPGAHYWLDAFVGLDITNEIVRVFKEKNIVEFYSE